MDENTTAATSNSDATEPHLLSRREFARRAGAAAMIPLAGVVPGLPTHPPPLIAGDAAFPEGRADRPAAAVGGLAGQDQEDEPPGVDALLEYVRARFGDRLSEEDLAEIRDGIAGSLRAGARISEVQLANSDEPGPVFSAYRGDGR